MLALDKPAGISVMGERHDTDLVRLAAAAGEELFPVHRIDKATSGLVLFARELRYHGDLTRQFQRRTVDKGYLVLTRTRGLPAAGTVELPLSVGRKNRVRIAANRGDIVTRVTAGADSADPVGHWSVPAGAVFGHVRSYPSVTTFRRLWEGGDVTLLLATPVSGRRHQIRVHLAWIGHPIEGDPLFDRAATSRTLLHSWRLALDSGGARRRLEAQPGSDFWAPVRDLVPPELPGTLSELLPWPEQVDQPEWPPQAD
ncbi:RNA pseudouridine synthase [Frankia sp. AgB32]|uniref:pseudouridine synthase family protein n=1 Tax=Frankia sp. AgB32 TaxID=631119 RepID=UPI00200E4DF0|nr:RNA pseudouridine synthase [Frankia sp. AgB32]MCK9895899.1 RNA pseudouridine synthase [Frankia sp. AgB32]